MLVRNIQIVNAWFLSFLKGSQCFLFEYIRDPARTAYNSNVMRDTTWWLLAAGNKPCMLKSRWGLNFITIRKNIFPRDPTRNSVFHLDILVICLCRVSCSSSAARYPSYPLSLPAWFFPIRRCCLSEQLLLIS